MGGVRVGWVGSVNVAMKQENSSNKKGGADIRSDKGPEEIGRRAIPT